FFLFALIGGLGVATHLSTLWFGTHVLAAPFPTAQAAATVAAMTGNFLLNNLFTYRDRRLRGRALWTGLASFYVVCGLGDAGGCGLGRARSRTDPAAVDFARFPRSEKRRARPQPRRNRLGLGVGMQPGGIRLALLYRRDDLPRSRRGLAHVGGQPAATVEAGPGDALPGGKQLHLAGAEAGQEDRIPAPRFAEAGGVRAAGLAQAVAARRNPQRLGRAVARVRLG